MRRAALRLAVLASFVVVGSVVACVGSDPGPSSDTSPDASTGGDSGGTSNDGSATDGGADGGDGAPAPHCDPNAPFTVIAPLNDVTETTNNDAGQAIQDEQARLSPDERTIYFVSNRFGLSEIVTAGRGAATDAFGAAAPVDIPVSGGTRLSSPTVGVDPDTLFFALRTTTTNPNITTIQVSQRAGANWGNAQLVDAGSHLPGFRNFPTDAYLTPDMLTLVFGGAADLDGGGKHDVVFESDRANVQSSFDGERELTELTSDANQLQPVMSADRLAIYFATNRATVDGGYGDLDMWIATRAKPTDEFGAPVPLQGTAINVDGEDDRPTWISADQCTLYFDSGRNLHGVLGASHLFKAVRKPN